MKRIFTILIFLTLFKTGWAQPHIAEEVLLPLYVQGYGDIVTSNDLKVPYACRLKISGLTPGATYRYHNRFIDANRSVSGYYTLAKESGFVRVTNPSLSNAARYGVFTADLQGNFIGWFISEVSNASVGQVQVLIRLNDGADGTLVAHELITTSAITVVNFGTDTGSGTALWSRAAGGTAMNFVMLYDNEAGTGRPVAGTIIEDVGSSADFSSANGYAPFYADNVNNTDKAWGTIIPNNLATGVRKIVQYKLSDGTETGSNVSADGTWPAAGGGTVSTVNTTQGVTAPLVLDGDEVALISGGRLPQTVSFASTIPAEAGIGDPGFTVSASSTSGLTDFQYSVSPAGVLEISGNTVTAVGVGNATITAYQPGNSDYNPASVVSSVIVVKKRRNISFAEIPSKTYGDDVFALEVSSDNSTIPLALMSSDPSIAEVFYESLEARWKIQIHGAGEVTITASQASNTEYFEASAAKSFSVQKKALTITADNRSKVVNATNPVFTATYDGFIPGEDETDLATPAVFSTTADESSPVGEYPIMVSGASSSNYEITFVNGVLQVANQLQVVTFPSIPNKMYGDDAFDPGAVSNTGVTPVYSSSNNAVAVIESNQVRIVGTGQVRITATFPATASFGSTASERTFTVLKKPLTITAVDKTKKYGQDNPQLTVSYEGFVHGQTGDALATKPVLITAADKLSLVGSYSITVSGATSVNYDISYVYGTLTIERVPLKITAESKSKVQGEPNPPLTASYEGFVNGETTDILASLPVLYTSADISSLVGEYTITVSGASAGNYEITYVDGLLTIKQESRTLTFNPFVARTYGEPDFEAGAVLSSSEIPEYKSSNTNVATIENGRVHIVSAGTTNITATAPPNSNYANTPTVTQTLVVNRAPQFITFAAIPQLSEGIPYDISVSSSVGLEVELMIEDMNVASLDGNQLVPHRAGVTKITASQQGNTNYLPADSYVREIRVADTEGNLIAVHQALSVNGDGVNESLVIDGIENYQENHLTIVNRNGTKVFEADNYDNELNAFSGKGNTRYYGPLPEGTYFYVLEVSTTTGRKKKTGFLVLKY